MTDVADQENRDLVERTHQLAKGLADHSALSAIKNIPNRGKRIEMGVSSTLILDTLYTFSEYRNLFLDIDDTKAHKSSISLLTRYLFELYVNFIYIFNTKRSNTQIRSKAFYYYGDYKKEKMRGASNITNEKNEWMKFVPKKKRENWHGRRFADLCDEIKYTPLAYQFLSQFTHPTIFIMERILYTDMFRGVVEDSVPFTTSQVCDIIELAHKMRLYGVKRDKNIFREMEALRSIHREIFTRHQKQLVI